MRADEVFRDTFRSPQWGVELVAPPDWQLSGQRSYPGILLFGSHKRGGRLNLAVQRVIPGETLRFFSDRNSAALRKLGYTIVSTTPHRLGALVVESATPDRATRVRQAYLVQNGVGYVLTMAVPTDQVRFYVRAFEDLLRGMSFMTPTFAPVATIDAGPPPDGGIADAMPDPVDGGGLP